MHSIVLKIPFELCGRSICQLEIISFPPQIMADVISFLVGGFHTSGYMITWLLWYLADNPQSQVNY